MSASPVFEVLEDVDSTSSAIFVLWNGVKAVKDDVSKTIQLGFKATRTFTGTARLHHRMKESLSVLSVRDDIHELFLSFLDASLKDLNCSCKQ